MKQKVLLIIKLAFICCCLLSLMNCEARDEITVLSEEEKTLYMPTSLTISIYDTKNLTYGFTYNTDSKPLRPVIQIEKGESLTENCEQYLCNVTEATSYNSSDKLFTYYIVKVEVALEPNTTYAYRVYDKYADIGTEVTTFTTTNPAATSFKFAHVSDSQVNGVDSEKTGTDTGIAFGNTLAEIVGNNDFIVHTGDVVEWSKYEAYWDNMLDYNFEYLSKIAMNAISGNHEAVYRSGSNETYKHFNNKIPEQDSTLKGYYYSFEYGNVKFIMLNTNHRNADDTLHVEQYNWLINELENNDCLWTIVSLHNPIYSVGKYGLSSSYNNVCLALRRQLQGVFAEYDVDIVLQGHDHAISRTKPVDKNGNPTVENWITEDGIEYSVDPNGVLYLMNGPFGSQAREVYKADKNASTIESYYHYAEKSNASSWAEFEVDGDTITVTVKYVDDEGVHDYYTWGIKKTIK